MKTIFDKTTRETLIHRIGKLNENSRAQWGNMNVYQMLRHCTLWQEMILGRKKFKRTFLGHLFGRIGLRAMIKDEKPMKPGLPTVPGFEIKDMKGDVEGEKKKWIELLEEHAQTSNAAFFHPFFGNVTKEQTGLLAYKHIDHHLRQFNV